MSNPEIEVVTVNIMGREFKIKCPFDKTKELQKAASYLNSKMEEVKHGDRSIAIDRVAIAAALNIAHELIIEKQTPKSQPKNSEELNQYFSNLKLKLDEALAN